MDTDALQTSKHILQECEVFAHLRHVIFKDAFPDDMDNITDKMLSDFIIQSLSGSHSMMNLKNMIQDNSSLVPSIDSMAIDQAIF